MPGLVGARARALLGRHQRAVAQPLRSRDRPQQGRCRCRSRSAASRCASSAASSSRCAAASGSRAADGTLDRKVFAAPYDPATHRFNDGRCDRRGRFFVGSMNERRDAPSATLVRVDLDGTMTEVLAGMTISNGLAWSPDGRTMYHADTPTHTVRAFDYDPDAGVPSRPRVFAQWQRRNRPSRRRRGRQRRQLLDRVLPRRQGAADRAVGRDARRVLDPGDVPDDVRVRRPGPEDPLRDDRAAEPRRRRSSRGCRIPAACSRCASTCPACPKRRSPAERRRAADALRSRRLPAPRRRRQPRRDRRRRVVRHVHGRHARRHRVRERRVSRAARPPHAARLRHPRRTLARLRGRPDRPRHLDVHQRRRGARAAGVADALPAAVEGRARAALDHRRALPRLDAAAVVRPVAARRTVDRRAGAAVGRAGLRPRREVRTARQARPAHPLAGRGRARRQHRPRVQERAVRVGSGHGRRRVGRLRAHAGDGHPRRRTSGLVAPQLRTRRRRRVARPLPVRRRHARRHSRRVHAADRARAGRAALEPRPVGVPRLLQDAGGSDRGCANAARSGAFRATC